MTGHPTDPQAAAGDPAPVKVSALTPNQLAAIARAASSVADAGSLSATLDVLADAVRSAAGIAAAQVVTVHDDGHLHVAGMSGFAAATGDFTTRLAECRSAGAGLVMLDVLDTGRPAVLPHRRHAVMADPRWAPIHPLLASTDWDGFACVPLIVRHRPVGLLTVFFPPGADPGPADLEFLTAMADQAAMAVDYAALLAGSRADAQRRERERIARDLHDSVVQQVFSLRLHARSLAAASATTGRSRPLDVARVSRAAEEITALATTALADLRDLIFELRPADITDHGLIEALRVHTRSVEARTGLQVRVECSRAPAPLDPDLEVDLYRIVQEAVHNAVKHADGTSVTVRVDADEQPGRIAVTVEDDGQGVPDHPDGRPHLGITSMTERTRRWGGTMEVTHRPAGGTSVHASVPHPVRPLADTTGRAMP